MVLAQNYWPRKRLGSWWSWTGPSGEFVLLLRRQVKGRSFGIFVSFFQQSLSVNPDFWRHTVDSWKKSCISRYGKYHYLQGFIHVGRCKISSINSITPQVRFDIIIWRNIPSRDTGTRKIGKPPNLVIKNQALTWKSFACLPKGIRHEEVHDYKNKTRILSQNQILERNSTKQLLKNKTLVLRCVEHEFASSLKIFESMLCFGLAYSRHVSTYPFHHSYKPPINIKSDRIHVTSDWLPTFTIKVNHPCRWIYQSHGSYYGNA